LVVPNIERGARSANRTRADVQLSSSIFLATDEAEAEAVRAQISFYASTPTYRAVLETHGWGAVGEQLSALASRGKWDDMPALVSDELLNEVAIIAPREEIPARVKERYTGLLDRIAFYKPFWLEDLGDWRDLLRALK